jgi:hypothetical protein
VSGAEANVPAFEPLDEDTSDESESADASAAPVVVIATKRCYGRCDELGLHIPSGFIDIEIRSDGSVRIV